jgi:hypothetical protein
MIAKEKGNMTMAANRQAAEMSLTPTKEAKTKEKEKVANTAKQEKPTTREAISLKTWLAVRL